MSNIGIVTPYGLFSAKHGNAMRVRARAALVCLVLLLLPRPVCAGSYDQLKVGDQITWSLKRTMFADLLFRNDSGWYYPYTVEQQSVSELITTVEGVNSTMVHVHPGFGLFRFTKATAEFARNGTVTYGGPLTYVSILPSRSDLWVVPGGMVVGDSLPLPFFTSINGTEYVQLENQTRPRRWNVDLEHVGRLYVKDVRVEWWLGLPRDVVHVVGWVSGAWTQGSLSYEFSLTLDGFYDRVSGIPYAFTCAFSATTETKYLWASRYNESFAAEIRDTNASLSVSSSTAGLALLVLTSIGAVVFYFLRKRGLPKLRVRVSPLAVVYSAAVLTRSSIIFASGFRLPFYDPGGLYRELMSFLQKLILPGYAVYQPGLYPTYGLITRILGVSTYGVCLWSPLLVNSLFAVSMFFLAGSLFNSRIAALFGGLLAAAVDFLALRTSYLASEGLALVIFPLALFSCVQMEHGVIGSKRGLALALLLVASVMIVHSEAGAMLLLTILLYLIAEALFGRRFAARTASLLGLFFLGMVVVGSVHPSAFYRLTTFYSQGQIAILSDLLSHFRFPELYNVYHFNYALSRIPTFLFYMWGTIFSIVVALRGFVGGKTVSERFLQLCCIVSGSLFLISFLYESMPYAFSSYVTAERYWIYSYRLIVYVLIPIVLLASASMESLRNRWRGHVSVDVFFGAILILMLLNSMMFLGLVSGVYS